jgi:cytochrome c5
MKRIMRTVAPCSYSRLYSKECTALQVWRRASQRLEEMSGGKQIAVVLFVILCAAEVAAAQVMSPTQDVLGAHNVYGRGCVACHTPHNGAPGNLARPSRSGGRFALWGQDLSPQYGISRTSAIHPLGAYTATVPDTSRGGFPSLSRNGYSDLVACLSCHDGNLATSDMMKGTTVETVSIAGVTFNPPTLVGNDESTVGSYMNAHPVGPNATISCGGKREWDCSVNADGSIAFAGPKARAFVADYFDVTGGDGPLNHLVKVPGSTVNGNTVTSKSWITCTTCHDQHDMPYFSTSNGAVKPTRFFVRGWYNPGSSGTSNSAAQFCRSCHADKSNEAKGRMVPTT